MFHILIVSEKADFGLHRENARFSSSHIVSSLLKLIFRIEHVEMTILMHA